MPKLHGNDVLNLNTAFQSPTIRINCVMGSKNSNSNSVSKNVN